MTADPIPREIRLDFDRSRYAPAWLATHPTEAQVQDAVCEYLRRTGWTVAVIDAGGRGLRNGGATRRSPAPIGFPDLYACKNGRGLHVECKRPMWLSPGKRGGWRVARQAGTPTPEQKAWLTELYLFGGMTCCVAWSVEDVIEAIEGTR